MASGMYQFGKQKLMSGSVDLVAGTLSCVLVSSSYTPDLVSDEYQADIPDAYFLDEVRLAGMALSGAALTADPITFTRVDAGATAAGVVLVKDTGDTSTSVLIAYLALTPFTTDGSDVVVNWNASGVLSL